MRDTVSKNIKIYPNSEKETVLDLTIEEFLQREKFVTIAEQYPATNKVNLKHQPRPEELFRRNIYNSVIFPNEEDKSDFLETIMSGMNRLVRNAYAMHVRFSQKQTLGRDLI